MISNRQKYLKSQLIVNHESFWESAVFGLSPDHCTLASNMPAFHFSFLRDIWDLMHGSIICALQVNAGYPGVQSPAHPGAAHPLHHVQQVGSHLKSNVDWNFPGMATSSALLEEPWGTCLVGRCLELLWQESTFWLKVPHDIDFATTATPDQMKEMFSK